MIVPLADGTNREKPFSECSRRDLDKAIARHKSPPLTVPPQDLKLVDRMTASLQSLLGATTSAAMKATYAGGKTFVDLTHVDIVRFEEVLKALLAAQPDPDVVKTPHASPRRSVPYSVKR